MVDLDHLAGTRQSGVGRIGGAEASGRDRALHQPLEPVGVEPGGRRLRDAAVVDHHAEADVALVARHVLVDAAVGEAREGVGALAARHQGVSAVADQLEHPVARLETHLGDRIGRVVPHQRTPTRTLANRAGTAGCPV